MNARPSMAPSTHTAVTRLLECPDEQLLMPSSELERVKTTTKLLQTLHYKSLSKQVAQILLAFSLFSVSSSQLIGYDWVPWMV